MPVRSFDELLSRIRSEYVEMPGLWLTAEQGTRLWGLGLDECQQLLNALVTQKFLIVRADGKYGRATEGTAAARLPLDLDPPLDTQGTTTPTAMRRHST